MAQSNGHTALDDPQPDISPQTQLARITRRLRNGIGVNFVSRPGQAKLRDLEAVYQQEPLLKRGILKHSGDAVKHWFTLTDPNGDTIPADDEFQTWTRRNQFKQLVRKSIKSSHVYGDGLVELEWGDDGEGEEPVEGNAQIVSVHEIDPVNVRFAKEGDEFFLVQQGVGGVVSETRLHPDRYHNLQLDTLAGFVHGLSTVETAWHVAMSKIKGDQGIGEILYHSGVPLRSALVEDGSPDELEAVAQMMSDPNFQRAVVWTDRLELDQLNPQTLDPEPYYQTLKESIAAAIGIPVMMLTGAQAGAVTGSETNIEDYHADLMETQENVLSPFVERVASGVLGIEMGSFRVKWAEFPTDQTQEASALRDKVFAFNQLILSGVNAEAAARATGLDIDESDMRDTGGQLPPGGGV